MNYKKLPKDVLSVIKPPVWNSYYYVSTQTRKAYEKKIPYLLKPDKKYDILDYGCGSKPYEYIFEGHINKYTGVDIGENPRADHKIEPGGILPFNDHSFDIVLSSQVLEHVEDVNQYMKECYRVLKPNGFFLLSTHGTWQYHASPHDFHRWTSIGLKKLIKAFGFRIIDFIPILGQLAVTSQLRLSFYDSFANLAGMFGRIVLAPVACLYQIKMILEDLITPQRVKDRDSAIFLVVGQKIS